MDLFTHMMISYILAVVYGQATGGISEPQLLFAVIAGIFPDFDVLTFWAWKKVPKLRHHGITHTLVFPVVNSFVLSGIVWLVWGLDPWQFIPIGAMTGVFHVVSDLITNYPVPLFAPGTWKGYSLAIDNAVNPYLMFPVLILIILFWNLRSMAFPFEVFVLYLGVVSLVIITHLLVKLAYKQRVKAVFRGEAEKVDAEPTMRYKTWFLALIHTYDSTSVREYLKVKLGTDLREPKFFEVEGPQPKVEGPIKDKVKAVLRSYEALDPERMNLLARGGDMASRVLDDGGGKGPWKVFWFNWFVSWRDDVPGVMVEVRPDGTVEVTDARAKVPSWS